MTLSILGLGMHVLAARGRAIQHLIDGDPVAWTVLVAVLAGMGGWAIYKKKRSQDGQ